MSGPSAEPNGSSSYFCVLAATPFAPVAASCEPSQTARAVCGLFTSSRASAALRQTELRCALASAARASACFVARLRTAALPLIATATTTAPMIAPSTLCDGLMRRSDCADSGRLTLPARSSHERPLKGGVSAASNRQRSLRHISPDVSAFMSSWH
jgi:hypothetical protein